MCGLAGIVHLDGAPPDRPHLEAMGQALSHRGPDAQGLWFDATGTPSVGLLHRRLSIIDLSAVANQPLGGEDGRVQVMLNGEIYNFAALRAELRARHTFRSHGDTEVIAHGYEEWGDPVVERLDGMFAFALWDAHHRRLVLARDHFGKKPLYYWSDARRFVFASEIKGLLAAGVPAALAAENLPEYLALGYVPTPRTLFAGIYKVPPASLMVVDAQGVHAPRPYWDLRFPAEPKAVKPDEVAERLGQLLDEAVGKRLVADVPLGVLLSGGLDSSVVAALAARQVGSGLRTFTMGFEGEIFYDERPHARVVAQHLKTRHHDSVVRPQAAQLLETLLHHHDEPFGDSSALPTYLLARETRQQVTVALNGDGGDETFAGYERFHAAVMAERLPGPLRAAVGLAGHLFPPAGPGRALRRFRRFALKAALPLERRLFAWSTFFDVPEVQRLIPAWVGADQLARSYHEAMAHATGSPLSRVLYTTARTYLLDDLLPKMDRMTMAHGLEARSPLLDRALVEYVASLPDGMKRRGMNGKLLLKDAARKLLPEHTLRRKKQGFGVPLDAWFRAQLKPMVHDILLRAPRLAGRLRLDTVRHLVREHERGRADHGQRLWTLLTLELWLRKHQFD
jgi:asparagine synthase (glutamine-hydrolysing)